ncbi:hypothetical protein MRX96_054228 [Rhipicephalus microplus]
MFSGRPSGLITVHLCRVPPNGISSSVVPAGAYGFSERKEKKPYSGGGGTHSDNVWHASNFAGRRMLRALRLLSFAERRQASSTPCRHASTRSRVTNRAVSRVRAARKESEPLRRDSAHGVWGRGGPRALIAGAAAP